MSYKIGESIANIQINISELQKECAVFDMELFKVINLARQIQLDTETLIDEFGGENESRAGQTDARPISRGVAMRPTCGSCRHFLNLDGDGEESFEGECRRRSPELLLDQNHGIAPIWPPVDQEHWCGDWTPEDLQ
jgi:hypothetical protein